MTRRKKLEKLNDLVIDVAIEELTTALSEDEEGNTKGGLSLKDLTSVITLLKNNKIVDDTKETPESELIDSLVKDKK